MTTHRLLAPALVCFALVASPALAQDAVFGEKGTPNRGTINKVSPTEVTVDVPGGDKSFPVNSIRKVTFFGEPNELDKAREQVRQKSYSNALEELKKIKVESGLRDLIKQDIEDYTAFCSAKLALAGEGDKNAAGVLLNNFIKANPSSYHYFEACETMGDLAASVGKFEGAAAFYGRLAEAPWPDYKVRASLHEARALVGTEKYDEALKKYEAVLAQPDTPEVHVQMQYATAGKAVCLAQAGKADEGIGLLQEMIAKEDPMKNPNLFARVYNALGACHAKAGRGKDAMLAYMHTDMLFSTDPESHAEALFHLTKLFADQSKLERSQLMRKSLTDRYPASFWVSRLK